MRPWWLVAVAVVAAACTRSSGGAAAKDGAHRDGASPAGERRPLFYRNPMNPEDTSPVPKKDAMGMDYVPVYPERPTATPTPRGMTTVQIDPAQKRLIGLKTARAQRIAFDTTIRTTGRVVFDETRVVKVQPRFEGFIETLNANFSGKYVRKGEPLATIYSPELLATEQELLLAKRAEGTLAAVRPARRRRRRARAAAPVRHLGRGDRAPGGERQADPRACRCAAPISGFVTAKSAVQGARVGPSDALFDLADLSVVWVIADVYEYELPRLRLGQTATLTLSYWPDKRWRGRVSYVFPVVDDKTRTVKVRIEVQNPRTELKPEMFADVTILGQPRQALVVPDDAVIDTGTRKVVFVVLGEGTLAPRQVQTGDSAHGVVEIRSGLQAGDEVATSANFLLDSESRLRSALDELEPADGGQR